MSKLILLFYLVLAMCGCERGHTIVTHAVVNGEDVVDSQVHIIGQLATFRCLRSKSGVCHFTVVSRECAVAGAQCNPPITTFSLRAGGSLIVPAMPEDFSSCATASPAAAGECADQLASATLATP